MMRSFSIKSLFYRLMLGLLSIASSHAVFATEQCTVNHNVNNAVGHYGEFALYMAALGNGSWCSYYYKFSEANFDEYADGTAELTGQLVNVCDSRKAFHITMDFADRSETAPAGSPYQPPQGVDLDSWHYYQSFSGSLQGQAGFYHGVEVALSKDGPAFQVGEGASSSFDNTITQSGAGWLNWNITRNPHHLPFHRKKGRGDVIIRLDEQQRACKKALDISKHIEGPDSRTMGPNDTATYNFSVTNTSDNDLHNVVVSDPLLPACDRTFATIAANHTETYSCSVDNIGDYAGLGGEPDVTVEEISGNWKDLFNRKSYSNNDGTNDFTSAWTESDAYGRGAWGGLVKVNHHKSLQMTNSWWKRWWGHPSSHIQRSVDLSEMDNATLTLKWATLPWVDRNDRVLVQVSTDGNDFTTIAKLAGRKRSVQTTQVDLSGYISSNTRVRLKLAGYYGWYEAFFLKSFSIDATGTIETENPNPTPDNVFINEACATAYDIYGNQSEDCDTSTIVIEEQIIATCERIIGDSQPQGANSYGFWLNQHGSESQADWFFSVDPFTSRLTEYSNGTARMQGNIVSHSGTYNYAFDIHLGGKTDVAPEGSPYLPGGPLDTSGWNYYTEMNGTVGPYPIGRRGPAVQVGFSANLNDSQFGTASWFTYSDTYGDFNIGLTECLH